MSNHCAHNESSTMQSSHAEPELTESMSITNLTGSTSSQQELVQKCLKVIEDFRSSHITKSEGIVSITQIIASQSPNMSDETISFIAEPYYSMLKHWASELSQAVLSRLMLLESQPLIFVQLQLKKGLPAGYMVWLSVSLKYQN
jgi:hypothetical protein